MIVFGHVGVVISQVGEQLLHRTTPARSAPEQQNLFGSLHRLGDGLVETLPFRLTFAISRLMGGMQVFSVSVRIVGCNPHGYSPVNLGTVDSCFVVVFDHQQTETPPPVLQVSTRFSPLLLSLLC